MTARVSDWTALPVESGPERIAGTKIRVMLPGKEVVLEVTKVVAELDHGMVTGWTVETRPA